MSTNQFNFSDGVKVGDVNIAGELFCGEILPILSAPLGDVNLKDILEIIKGDKGSDEYINYKDISRDIINLHCGKIGGTKSIELINSLNITKTKCSALLYSNKGYKKLIDLYDSIIHGIIYRLLKHISADEHHIDLARTNIRKAWNNVVGGI